VLDELITLSRREVELGDTAIPVKRTEIQVLVVDNNQVLQSSLGMHTRPTVQLADDLIDEHGRTGHGTMVLRDELGPK
jgi:hypothetical protein